MNLLRPWSTAAVVGLCALLLTTTTNAFLGQQTPHYVNQAALPKTCMLASQPQHKHRPTDRYSSTTVTNAKVVTQVSSLYKNGHCYQKTIKKVANADEAHSAPEHKTSTIPPNTLLNELNRYPALILNADYQPMSYLPLSVCHWQEAIKLIFSGKVAVVDVYEGVTIRAANLEIPLPAVVALNEYVPLCSHKPAFTRRNVFLRDEYTCQYCRIPFPSKDLSIDHVMPRSMGGRLTWDNAVTSCLKCNGRKGNLLLSDLRHIGMKLHTQPRAPTRNELAMKAGKMLPRKVHPTWQPYLASVMVGDTSSDQNRPILDYEALGIPDPFAPEDSSVEETPVSKTKVMSKNKQRKAKKQQMQQS